MKKYAIIIFLLLVSLYCSKNKTPVSPSEISGIAIYLLKDSNINVEQALKSDINSLNLQSKPWLSSKDISIYDFSTHFIYLKSDKVSYFNKIEDNQNLGLLPFVLVADNQRIYIGAIYTVLMAYIPPCPTINCVYPFGEYFPDDVITIINPIPPGEEDEILNDERIKNALIESSIYHAGLNIQLDSVFIVENLDTSTVQYTFSVKNNDKDNLYIPDSDLMGSELFHCYSGGVVFRNENGESTWAIYRAKQSPDTLGVWNPSWFTKLSSKKELKRTVMLKGYPKIKNDVYTCNFDYGGIFKIESHNRLLSDGRYWLGYILSNTITFEVKEYK